MKSSGEPPSPSKQQQLYDTVVAEFGIALDRLTVGYEADPGKRQDLRQEIHFQLWRSFALFDGRCSLKTWSFRVAHNTAVSYVNREHRKASPLVGLEEIGHLPIQNQPGPTLDTQRSLDRLTSLIRQLKPLDRQIILCYLEEMDTAATAEITGLSPANVSMKIHRIKATLARHFNQERQHV